MTKNILDGIRVLDMTIFQLGPIQGIMLAAMGAEVIKIEAPNGDPGRALFTKMPGTEGKVPYYPHMTSYFESCNQNKKGIVLDLKLPKAKEILYELVAKSDIFINNMRMGVAERLGADYETLKKYNSKLIYCAGNSFGSQGPEAAKPGFDFTGAARTGVFFRAPTKDGEPMHSMGGSCDQVPAMMGAFAIVAALLAREGRDFELRLAGPPDDPAYLEGLERRAQDRGLAGRVVFLGSLSPAELVTEMGKAGIFVLPSRQETSSVALKQNTTDMSSFRSTAARSLLR